MTQLLKFNDEANAVLAAELGRLRQTTFAAACSLPRAESRDVVIAQREVLLTIFRQSELPGLSGQVLVTVQLARHGLGGVITLKMERGLVFSPDTEPREATDVELASSGG